MDLDPYAPCPCGSGKKLKFCCCRDILHDLERVIRMLDGDQRLAAHERIAKLLTKYPDRPALLALQGVIELEMEQVDEAQQTVSRFLEVAPDNPSALAQSAILKVATEGTPPAVRQLQRAVEQIDAEMPESVYDAYKVVAQRMIAEGNYLGALAHLAVVLSIDGVDDSTVPSWYAQISTADQVPLLLKQSRTLAACPDDVSWKKEFDAVMELANRGAWLAAADKFEDMSLRILDEPAILKNLAVLRGRLGEEPAAVAAYHAYAAVKGVPLDEAVEAEATAQLLNDELRDRVDEVLITYRLPDVEALMERFLSDGRVSRVPVDPASLAADDQPPPKGVFWLLDRALPSTGVGLTRQDVPTVLGDIHVYGKQTDRDARLEFTATRTANFADKTATLREVAGDTLEEFDSQDETENENEKEKVLGQRWAVAAAMSLSWRLPEDTPPEVRRTLMDEQRRENVLHVWPELKMAVLDGKMPREAAADRNYWTRILAAILLLELASQRDVWGFDFNELRRELNLPTRDPVDPEEVPVSELSVVRLAQVIVDKLSDQDLLHGFQIAQLKRAHAALRKLGAEILERPQLKADIDLAGVCGLLAEVADDSDQALSYIQKGRQLTAARGESVASWLIVELDVRLQRREGSECQRVLRELKTRYAREPGISQQIVAVLAKYGLVSPSGQPPPAGEAPAPANVAAAPPAQGPGKLWTPGEAPAEQGSEPSDQDDAKIWVPGMD